MYTLQCKTIFLMLILLIFGISLATSQNWTGLHDYEYLIVPESVQQPVALQRCINMGASLVVVHNETVQDFLVEELIRISNIRSFWIGLEKTSVGFSWVDGTSLDYTNWNNDNEDNDNGEDCVVMGHPISIPSRSMFRWFSLPCNAEISLIIQYLPGYICQRKKDNQDSTSIYSDYSGEITVEVDTTTPMKVTSTEKQSTTEPTISDFLLVIAISATVGGLILIINIVVVVWICCKKQKRTAHVNETTEINRSTSGNSTGNGVPSYELIELPFNTVENGNETSSYEVVDLPINKVENGQTAVYDEVPLPDVNGGENMEEKSFSFSDENEAHVYTAADDIGISTSFLTPTSTKEDPYNTKNNPFQIMPDDNADTYDVLAKIT